MAPALMEPPAEVSTQHAANLAARKVTELCKMQTIIQVNETAIRTDKHEAGNEEDPSCIPPPRHVAPFEATNPHAVDSWAAYLQDVQPCLFPSSSYVETSSESITRSINVHFQDSPLLYSLCGNSGTTPATVLKVGWLLLLQSYTGNDSVCFGCLSSDREIPVPEEEISGSFLNMRICRFDLAMTQTPTAIMNDVQQDYNNSLSYQDLSLTDVLQRSSLSRSPFFNTALSIQEYMDDSAEDDRRIERTSVGEYSIEHNMLCKIKDSGTSLSIDINYPNSLMSEEQALRVGNTLQTILHSILTAPNDPISAIKRLSEDDNKQILRWNENVRPSLNQYLHHAFIEKALDNPDSPAISAWDGELTYSELDEASSRVASYILCLTERQGSSPVIPFCFEKSKWAIVAMLAILKTGSACVPLNPLSSSSQLGKTVADVDADIICVSTTHADQFSTFEGKVVIIDSVLLESLRGTRHSYEPIDRQSDIAFIQYTTGAMGAPKGVIQGHAALYTGILAQGHVMGYCAYSRILQYSAYTDYLSVGDVFGAFLYGGCVVVISEEQILGDLTQTINDQDITHACLTPTISRTIRTTEIFQFSSLALGGESLTARDVETWSFETELIKFYGTTETSVWCTTSKSPSPHVFSPSNIGTSFAASMWVVDPSNVQKLLPIGSIGELVIGGPTLAHGYLNDPVGTANAFISNPAWAPLSPDSTHQRFFRTGDLVKHLGNGELAFCGRRDAQTALNGQKKEPRNRNREIQPFALLAPTEDLGRVLDIAAAACSVGKTQIEDVYPATSIQESLFALSTKEPGAFVKQHIFELPLALDLEKFWAAWMQVIQRSPILRTRLVMTDSNELMQVVVNELATYNRASNLESYLESDQNKHMTLGAPLARFAITKSGLEEISPAHFVLTMHHGIYDGWTLSILFEKVKQAFENNTLDDGVGFNAFVRHVKNIDQPSLDHFWRSQLEDAPVTSFPPLPTTAYQPIPNDTYVREVAFLRKDDSPITSSTLVRAAWALTVARYADSHDVTFGSTLSGRNAAVRGINSMLGPTIATVPVRVVIAKDGKLKDYLQQIQDQSTAMIPFEQAGLYYIKQLSPGSKAACTFQTAIIVQPLATAPGLESLGCRRVNELYDSFQPYAFTIEFGLQDFGGTIRTLFDDNVIAKPQVQRIISQFSQILQKISLEDPELTIDDIATVTQDDMEEINRWNSTPPGPVLECVHEAFVRQAALNPYAMAIASWDGDFSYAELDSLSTRLSQHLLSLNVTLEMIVPLCFDKSKWVVVSMLAVLKAGGACLTLDVSHPTDRLRAMIDAVDGKIMLVGEAHKSKFVGAVERVIVIDESFVESLPTGSGQVCNVVQPNNRAFVVFTSGSTGMPKGIELEHQSVCSSSRGHAAVFDIGPGSRCLQFSAFAFDVHISDIFTPLMYGACCCIPSEEERMGNLPSAINRLKADSTYITPTVATLFKPDDVPGLKKVALGGEPLTKENARLWGGKVFLINVFGPSETSNWVTYQVVTPDTQQPSNIGPGVDVCTWLVDPNDSSRLAPIGCLGELFVGGPILARGYLNDEIKTLSEFVVDPPWVSAQQKSPRRMYRTGDLVRYNNDGTFVYVGRKDTQIKIRGQRLELAEVEHRLMEIPETKNSLIVLPKTGLCSGRLVAVLSLKRFSKEGSLSELRIIESSLRGQVSTVISDIRDCLAETLAIWMVPTLWIVVEEMPANASGKLDRNKIRSYVAEIDEETFDKVSDLLLEKEFQAPQTSMEIYLQNIWSSVLKIPANQISATASFLRLGGDSVTAMQVMSKCRAEGVLFSVRDILQSRTISELAARAKSPTQQDVAEDSTDARSVNGAQKHAQGAVDSQSASLVPSLSELSLQSLYESIKTQASLEKPDIETIMVASDYQISALEQAMLKFRGDMTYHIFDIKRPVNVSWLKESCSTLVDRHSNLRSVFVAHQRQVFQVTLKSSILDFQEFNNQEHSTDSLIDEDLEKGFSLGSHLVWFKFIDNGKDQSHDTLVVRLPHCVYDATTRATVYNDLLQAYQGSGGMSDHVDSLEYLEFKEYIRPTAEKYWREYLEGSTATPIIARPGPSSRYSKQQNVAKEIVAQSLKEHSITLATLVKAAWGFVLAEISGQQDVTFGEVVAGRNLPINGVEKLDNICATTIPLRVQFQNSWSVLDILRQVQDRQLASMPFESVGTASIVENCTTWPRWTRFGSVVNHIALAPADNSQQTHVGGSAFVLKGICGNINASSDISISTHPQSSNLNSSSSLLVKITFDNAAIAPEFASEILDRLCSTIQDFSKDPNAKLTDKIRGPIGARTIPLPFVNGPIPRPETISLAPAVHDNILSIVRKAWEEVTGSGKDKDSEVEKVLHTNIPFYSRWGSLVAAAHFVEVYKRLGVELEMEDILGAPTINGQVLLCAKALRA